MVASLAGGYCLPGHHRLVALAGHRCHRENVVPATRERVLPVSTNRLCGRSGSRRTERRCVFGRLTRFAGVADDGSLERYLGLVRERVLPVVRDIPGFSGYLALSDDERGEVLVLTLWGNEQQLRASEETTVQLRSQAADKVGATVVSVERFRVAISELDLASA